MRKTLIVLEGIWIWIDFNKKIQKVEEYIHPPPPLPRFLIQLTKEPQHKPSSPRTLLTISFSSSPTLTGFVTRCSTSPYHCWLHSLSLSTPVRFQVSPASRPSTSSSGTSPFQNHQNLRWICGLGVLGLWFVIWGFLICDLGLWLVIWGYWFVVLWVLDVLHSCFK